DLQIHRHQVRLEEDNTTALLRGYDLVLDGTDNFTTRYVVNDSCAELGIPLIWASIFRTDAQVSVFWSRPPQDVEPRTLRDLFPAPDRKSTRLNSSHVSISYAVLCLN